MCYLKKHNLKYFCCHFREKPGHLTNSQITLTSRRLSQNLVYTADNLRSPANHGAAIGSSGLSVDSQQLAADMPLNAKKSVTFDRNKGNSLVNGDLANGTLNGEISSTPSDVSSGSGCRDHHRSSNRHWYTQPLHLSARDTLDTNFLGWAPLG